jgi:hypothetical protein
VCSRSAQIGDILADRRYIHTDHVQYCIKSSWLCLVFNVQYSNNNKQKTSSQDAIPCVAEQVKTWHTPHNELMNMMSPWHPCSLRACLHSWGTGRLVPSVSDGHLIMDTLLRLCGHLTPSWTTQRTPLESLSDCIPNLSLSLGERPATFEGALVRGFTASPLDCTYFIDTLACIRIASRMHWS